MLSLFQHGSRLIFSLHFDIYKKVLIHYQVFFFDYIIILIIILILILIILRRRRQNIPDGKNNALQKNKIKRRVTETMK